MKCENLDLRRKEPVALCESEALPPQEIGVIVQLTSSNFASATKVSSHPCKPIWLDATQAEAALLRSRASCPAVTLVGRWFFWWGHGYPGGDMALLVRTLTSW